MKDKTAQRTDNSLQQGRSPMSSYSARKDHDTGRGHGIDVINQLCRIYDQIQDGIVCFTGNNRIIMVNDRMTKLLGFKKEEFLGRNIADFHPDKPAFESQLKTAMSSVNQAAAFEEVLTCRHGEEVAMEVSIVKVDDDYGNVLCFIQRFHNITDKRELENALHMERNRFNIIANYSYNWEWWADPNGRFIYMSPSCERFSGYSAKEFLDDPELFNRILLPEDVEKWTKHLGYRKAVGRRELQVRIIRKDGMVRWLEHCCQAIVGEQGNLLGFRSSNQDITAKKTYEEELQQSLAEIERIKENSEETERYTLKERDTSKKYPDIIGESDALQYIFFKIDQIAKTNTTVLLLGETGTGKELIAKSIHQASDRSRLPLTTINCATLPAHLIESELFGHERGSFTGAHVRYMGRFEQADKGTVFLDEIGELPLELQAKLLRVLQEGEFERLGGSKTIKVDVRIIAATNRDLEAEVKKAMFRSDLWYRLNVFPITAPPLRERGVDIAQLALYFTEKFAKQHNKTIPAISKNVMAKLLDYSWPGNVRELENVIERGVINSTGRSFNLTDNFESPQRSTNGGHFKTLQEMERDYIVQALEQTGWKVSGKNSASEILGLKRSTLRARMEKYSIRKP